MAKKKRYFKKKAVLKAISRYQRRKMNYVMDINWANGSLTIDGQQHSTFAIGEVLSGNTSEFQTLGKQYAMVKLRGISIDAVQNSYVSGKNMGICLGQANDSIQFNNIKTQPNLMIFGKYSKNRMYIPISGEFTSTNSIELFTNMVLIPFASSDTTSNYTIRIVLYLTFKTTL